MRVLQTLVQPFLPKNHLPCHFWTCNNFRKTTVKQKDPDTYPRSSPQYTGVTIFDTSASKAHPEDRSSERGLVQPPDSKLLGCVSTPFMWCNGVCQLPYFWVVILHNVYRFHAVYCICFRIAAGQWMVWVFYSSLSIKAFGGLLIACISRKVSLTFSANFVP